MTDIRQKAERTLIAPISQAELAVRIAEAVLQISRPPGMTPEQALAALMSRDRDPDRWLRAADAAMGYLRECIKNANEVN